MFGRKREPCPACEEYRSQLEAANQRIDALLSQIAAKPVEPAAIPLPEPEEEPIPQSIRNAIHRAVNRASGDQRASLLEELEDEARLLLSEEVDEQEIVRRIITGDWDGEMAANANADAMR